MKWIIVASLAGVLLLWVVWPTDAEQERAGASAPAQSQEPSVASRNGSRRLAIPEPDDADIDRLVLFAGPAPTFRLPRGGPVLDLGKGARKERNPATLERNFVDERERRVRVTARLVAILSPRLRLTRAQAEALVPAMMNRGDTVRMAHLRKVIGILSEKEKAKIRAAATKKFRETVRGFLDTRQFDLLHSIEEDEEAGTGRDLGFGTAYSQGGGTHRGEESIPGPATARSETSDPD